MLKLRTDLNKSNKAAYAEGTRRNFRVQWESYLLFCAYFNFVSLPTTTETLQLYAQFLSWTFKSTDSIRNYINGDKSMHLLLGYSVEHINRFILGLSLKGIAKLNPYCRKQAEPITPALLVPLASCLNFAKKNDIVFWCLFLFAFFLLARKSNLVPTSMAFLRRNIRPASQQAKSTAYKTFVRPTLEYASTVWSPHTDTDSNQLEMVQRRAARFVKSDYSRKSSVIAMRQDLGWDTLLQRRDQARLSMMYRIAHQQVDIPAERYLTPLDNRTRGHNIRFRQIPTSFTGYQQSFFPRTIVLWNQLPQEAVSQSTLEAFQIQLATLTP